MLRVLCPHHKRYKCAQLRSPSGKRWFACQTIYKSQFGGVALTRRAATERGTSAVEEPRSGLTPRWGRSPRGLMATVAKFTSRPFVDPALGLDDAAISGCINALPRATFRYERGDTGRG